MSSAPSPACLGFSTSDGEQDSPGAGAESWFEADELLELLESSVAQEFQECAGLAAGDDKAVDVVELLGLFDEHNFGAEFFEAAAVGVKIALQGQDSDLHDDEFSFVCPRSKALGLRPKRPSTSDIN